MAAGPKFQKNLGFEATFLALLQEAIGQLGERSKARVQGSLSTLYPPSSKPGESPHLRTGKLRAGVSAQTSRQDQSVKLRISSDRAGTPIVPQVLEFKLRRFYMKPEYLRMMADAPAELAKLLRTRLK